MREHVFLGQVTVAIRLAARLASDPSILPRVWVEVEDPSATVIVASIVLGGPVLPAVISLRAAEIGDGGEDESVAEQSEVHPGFCSVARPNTLTGGPLERHMEVGAEKRQYIVAIDAEAEDVDAHAANHALRVSAVPQRRVHLGVLGIRLTQP